MDRDVLEKLLGEGLSLGRIGRLVGRHPSTVGYWVSKHGLVAVGAQRHAPRGGVEPATLKQLIDDGLTIAEIAERLDRSQSTINYWLRKHRLSTMESNQHQRMCAAREAGLRKIEMHCARHGRTDFTLIGGYRYRCARCIREYVARRRRKVKALLVEESGGRCAICGYDRYLGALEFHHLDPASKEFQLSVRGLTLGIEKLRVEARKCVLLCSNCHAEVEAGLAVPPA
jgi:transposase-like protein